MIIKAYAKINLTLDITGIMDNGFHSLRSVMAPISLSDDLVIEKNDEIVFRCNLPSISGDDNLCVRAAKAFFKKSGVEGGAKISLTKKIPFPAGLGGGSADAAAVLKGLNEIYGKPLSMEQLFQVSETLGSDISLCLLGRCALCEGKGDVLTPLNNLPKLNVVIAIGEGRLSTPAVYKEFDKMNLPVRNDTDAFISALGNSDVTSLCKSCGNAFEPVTDILCPETKLLREKMCSLGAVCSHLSGSGPSVYGIFIDESSGKHAAEQLKQYGYSAYFCQTI